MTSYALTYTAGAADHPGLQVGLGLGASAPVSPLALVCLAQFHTLHGKGDLRTPHGDSGDQGALWHEGALSGPPGSEPIFSLAANSAKRLAPLTPLTAALLDSYMGLHGSGKDLPRLSRGDATLTLDI